MEKFIAVAAWLVFVWYVLKFGILLYFGIATPATTTLFYITLCISAILFIDVLSNRFKASINPNFKVLIVTTCLTLFCGEYALRYIFKKNLVYSEQLGAPYFSFYSYIYDWCDIKTYLFGQTNYWYLKNEPNSMEKTGIGSRHWEHKYNSQGFREGEKPPFPDDTAHLVIGLGDSFTEGTGTHGDSTWLRFFERNMNAKSNCKVRTFNAGAKGSDVFFEYLVLEKLLEEYHPNTVVLCVNSSDIDDIIIKGGRNRFKPGGKLQFNSPPTWERLYAVSFIFRAIMHSSHNLDWTMLTFKEKAQRGKEALDSISFCIKQFDKLAKQKNFNLVVVFHPREQEIISGDFALDSLAEKLAADKSLRIVNLKTEFVRSGAISKQNSSAYYWKTDLHHNTEGYKAMGDAIAGYVLSEKIMCAGEE